MLADESKKAEKELVSLAWDVLSKFDHFVTKNGNEFDIPVLKMRSLINRVRPAVQIATKKYTIQNHTDIQAVINNWKPYQKGTLEAYSQLFLGKSVKENLSGDMVQDTWDMELFEDIGNYCEGDCEATFQIFELLTQFYL